MSTDFRALGLSAQLVSVTEELGYAQVTPIQAKAIPVLLEGKDLVGQSRTGSGKTAAFGLPILHKLEKLSQGDTSLQAVVLCPTRELSAQVTRELRKLGRKHKGLSVLSVYGGEPFRPQADSLARGVHVLVGTPGRVLDHLARRTLDLSTVTTLVLDEADRMLEMGFQNEMEQILAAAPSRRQTALFSATFPPSISSLSRKYQRDAVRVTIDDAQESPPEIRHLAITAEPDDKASALCWELGQHAHESVLVFCNFKASVASLARTLSRAGVSVDTLHGDLDQFERDSVLAKFRGESVRVLIATDVAARGIDVEDLDLVVNYELSPQPEVYLHRVGRTGRAGKQGLAISLVTERERARLPAIEGLTGAAIERLKRPADSHAAPGVLARAFARPPRMNTVLISGGRKDKVRPGDILGALTGEAGGLAGSDIGKIEIHDRLAYVAVTRESSEKAIASLNAGRIKGKRFRASLV